MSNLPIEPYLIELIQRLETDEIPLIVAGGLGIYLKRRWVDEQRQANIWKPLFDTIPDARATDDIDAFLQIEVFFQPRRADFRQALRELGYAPHTHYLIFTKPLPNSSERAVSEGFHHGLLD